MYPEWRCISISYENLGDFPASHVHWRGSCSSQPPTLQAIGEGPWDRSQTCGLHRSLRFPRTCCCVGTSSSSLWSEGLGSQKVRRWKSPRQGRPKRWVKSTNTQFASWDCLESRHDFHREVRPQQKTILHGTTELLGQVTSQTPDLMDAPLLNLQYFFSSGFLEDS